MAATRGKTRAAAEAPRHSKKQPRTRLDVEERRAQLVALGLQLFSGRAYDEVSIDEVAQAAGISKGLLYHYFQTKRDFYVAAIREAARQLLSRTLAFGDLPVQERPRAALDAYLSYVERQGKAYAALYRGGIGSDAEVIAIIEGTRTSILEDILASLPFPERPPTLRLSLRGWIGFVEATSLEWIERRSMDRAALRDLLAELFVAVVATALKHAAAAAAKDA
jgi:AcrR family transcriptional regulator